MNDHTAADIDRSATQLMQAAGTRRPEVAVLLGSGWNGLTALLTDAVAVPYGALPGFPHVGVAGHAGQVLIGSLGGRPVALLCGREHPYESGRADAMKVAVRTLARIGVKVLVLTSATGSLDLAMRPGELMLLSDHLNLAQRSPLFGEPGSDRFVDMGQAYDAALRRTALALAAQLGVTLHEGVYAWMMGPQFETPAEIRMLVRLGAQAVGMSTVPETILARHAGLRVLGCTLLTNMGCGLSDETLSHDHTLATAQSAGEAAARYLAALIPALEL